MARRDLASLCRAMLPPGFEQASRQLPKIQAFLDTNLPEPVRGQVTLLSVTEGQIVIAASTPVIANYLRLHSTEIEQQLRETFRLEQPIRFRSMPDALLSSRKPVGKSLPREVGPEAVDAIKRNAQWIDDESLREAFLSLADSLEKDEEEH